LEREPKDQDDDKKESPKGMDASMKKVPPKDNKAGSPSK
jgi:hypothetical protein